MTVIDLWVCVVNSDHSCEESPGGLYCDRSPSLRRASTGTADDENVDDLSLRPSGFSERGLSFMPLIHLNGDFLT